VLAADVMSRKVVALAPSDTLRDACLAFARAGISGAPVTDAGGRLLGILSETDILAHLKRLADSEVTGRFLTREAHSLAILALLGEGAEEAVAELLGHLRTAMVKEAMSKRVITAAPGSPMAEVVALMVRHDINRVPIVEGGRLVGIVTRADVMEYLGKS